MITITTGKSPPRPPKYFPSGREKRAAWMKNFDDKLTLYGPACNIAEPEIEATKTDLKYLLWYENECQEKARKFYEAVNNFQQYIARGGGGTELSFPQLPELGHEMEPRPPGVLDRLFNLVSRMKLSPSYNEQFMGRDLEIVLPQVVRDEDAAPEFTLTLRRSGGRISVEIGFRKRGHPAVAIDCRVNGGAWRSAGVNNKSPHIDDQPLLVDGVPETREYRLCWWDKGKAHGEWSAIQSISVTP